MNLLLRNIKLRGIIIKILLLSLKKTVLKENGLKKMKEMNRHILFLDFLENYYVSKDEISKQYLNVIKKQTFVKANASTIRSTHPPLDTVVITCDQVEMKACPFKIADDATPIVSIIEQNNFTNESLHIIGQ